jgi:hypothetical protein
VRVTPAEFAQRRDTHDHKVEANVTQRRRRLAGEDALVHRCGRCGDWCFDQEPCGTCARLHRQRPAPIVGNPVTTTQIGHRFGVTRGQASMWAKRREHNGFPAPIRIERRGAREVAIYDWDAVVAWWIEYVPPGARYVPDIDQEETA